MYSWAQMEKLFSISMGEEAPPYKYIRVLRRYII